MMKKSIYDKLEHLAERLAEIDGLLGGEHAGRGTWTAIAS
jgi:hypothetical protein